MVSDESDHLFSRPALMYVFAGQLTLADTEPFDRGLYGRLGVERVRGRVTRLDGEGRTVVLEDGRAFTPDRLLLAVGSVAREAPWAGAEGPGVHGFVTLRDLERLDGSARAGQRAVVIGGGLIGVEVAEILRHRGLRVTWLVRERWYFPVALDEAEALMVAEHVRRQGVDVRLGAGVEEILRHGDGRVRAVRAGGEEIPCDLVAVTIGVVPNTSFLRDGPVTLSAGGAIEVDDALRTSVPGVWAAGDCANVTWADGTRRPEQLWYTARDQGRVAAAGMLGDEVAYRRGTWYNSAKFFDLEYTTAGWIPVLLDADDALLPRDPELRTWFQRVPGRFESQRIVCRGDRVVGFNMIGGRWSHEVFLRWIRDRRPLPWVVDHLGEAQFDEELSPRFRVHPSAGLR